LAPLFGTVEGRSAREALCNTVRVIGQREALHASLGELVSSLNAWDRKRIDEPDFDVRLKAHKEINAILSKGTPPSTDWVYLVLYNCFHFVRKVSDFLVICVVFHETQAVLSLHGIIAGISW